jgi:hypothetical protein
MIISLLLQMSGSPLQAVDSWFSQKISSPSSRTTTKDWLMFSEVRLQPLWWNQSAPGLTSISEWQLFPLTIWLCCTECWCPHQHTRHVSSCSVTATTKPASSVRSSDSEKGVYKHHLLCPPMMELRYHFWVLLSHSKRHLYLKDLLLCQALLL